MATIRAIVQMHGIFYAWGSGVAPGTRSSGST